MEQINRKFMNWASILEEEAREQAEQTASMPFVFPHLALMPDAHHGKGATVGSVIPTLGAIIPAAVGVDIGCGMIAVRTQLHETDIAGLDRAVLREAIEKAIPVSAGKYNDYLLDGRTDERVSALEDKAVRQGINLDRYAKNWRFQLGTLGGGNHFCELCLDEGGRVWLFLHSGSRGIGNKIATHHIKVAADLCKRWWIDLPNPDLAYLVEGTPEFGAYIREMMWAQDFALANREEMMDRMVDALQEWVDTDIIAEETINCHHNYTVQERHWGKQVWLSRKGAINAEKGRPGLIPGSMGTASYVVEGKGNALSLNSSPHGAGRNFSRRKARETFTHAELQESMIGIEWRDSEAFLDEIPGAYKPIDQVMADAADLVTVKHQLRQLINVKGE